MRDNNLLQVQGLQKSFADRKVVDQVDLQVADNEFVGLLGPNGAGKTTTFRMCMGMIRPDQGTVLLRGHNVTDLPIHRRARLGMGYLAQEPSVFRNLTVEENLLGILEATGVSTNDRRERTDSLLEEFGLANLKNSRGEVLSGGERRRLEISRALANRPSLLLLDEPFSGIDPIAVEEIQEILLGLKNRGIAILLTDHNVRETLQITDRAYILADGKVFAHGKPQELVNDEQVRQIYLGRRFELS